MPNLRQSGKAVLKWFRNNHINIIGWAINIAAIISS